MRTYCFVIATLFLLFITSCDNQLSSPFPTDLFKQYHGVQDGSELVYVCGEKNDTMMFRVSGYSVSTGSGCSHGNSGEEVSCYFKADLFYCTDENREVSYQVTHTIDERKEGSIVFSYLCSNEDDAYRNVCRYDYWARDVEYAANEKKIFEQLNETAVWLCVYGSATMVPGKGIASLVEKEGNI